MAQQTPTPQPDLPPRNPLLHNGALVGTLIIPLVMLLPPRKLDARFMVLAGALSLSTNQLAYEYTGQSIYSRFGNRVTSVFDTALPEGAQRSRQLLLEHRERESQHAGTKQENNSGLIKDIWMGNEGRDWSRKRAEEHTKSIQEGKGLSGIILEQVMDVWSGRWRSTTNNSDHDKPNTTGPPPPPKS